MNSYVQTKTYLIFTSIIFFIYIIYIYIIYTCIYIYVYIHVIAYTFVNMYMYTSNYFHIFASFSKIFFSSIFTFYQKTKAPASRPIKVVKFSTTLQRFGEGMCPLPNLNIF